VPGTDLESTRELIIATTKTLLRKYGNDKLTVIDIARALDMSHANIYRFFRNKSDILDAIIDEWLNKLEAFVEDVAARHIPAAERIEAIVVELHRKRKQKLLEDAEVFETYRRIVEIRPDAAARRRQKIYLVFKRLVEEGTALGEFLPVDSHDAATALKDGTSLFLHPFLIPTTLNEETEARAQKVVRFILNGFKGKRPPKPNTKAHRGQRPPPRVRRAD